MAEDSETSEDTAAQPTDVEPWRDDVRRYDRPSLTRFGQALGRVEVTETGLVGTSEVMNGAVFDDGSVHHVDCDLAVTLQGTPYAGECDGCTFAFDVDATVVRDAGDMPCDSRLSFRPDDTWLDPLLAFFEVYSATYVDVPNVLAIGGPMIYYGTLLEGPYFQRLVYDGPSSSVTFDGEVLEWSRDVRADYYYYVVEHYYYQDCGDTIVKRGDADQTAESAPQAQDGVSCSGTRADVYRFETDGETVTVTVDTVDPQRAFHTAFYINDESGCTLYSVYGNFDCTWSDYGHECASLSKNLPAGAYELVVYSTSEDWECPSSQGEYELRIDNGVVLAP